VRANSLKPEEKLKPKELNHKAEKANLQNQTLHKALRPMVQLHKTTPNTKKTTSNTHNLTVS